jgi:hypothetical protein
MLPNQFFDALHGDYARSSVPYQDQELALIQISTALRLSNGAPCAQVKDYGTKEMG